MPPGAVFLPYGADLGHINCVVSATNNRERETILRPAEFGLDKGSRSFELITFDGGWNTSSEWRDLLVSYTDHAYQLEDNEEEEFPWDYLVDLEPKELLELEHAQPHAMTATYLYGVGWADLVMARHITHP